MPFPKTVSVVLFWIVYVAIHILSLWHFVAYPVYALLFDALSTAFFLTLSYFAVKSLVVYGNYALIAFSQQLVNNIALLLLLLFVSGGFNVLFDYLIFGEEFVIVLLPLLPIKTTINLLLFIILLLIFYLKALTKEALNQPEELPVISQQTEQEVADMIERISVKAKQQLIVIQLDDILCIKAYGDYVKIGTMKGEYLKEQTMKYYEQGLPHHQFIRIHRSYIVNIQAITRIEQYNKQSNMIILKNGEKLKISLSGYKVLKGALNL
ncbi:MAG: LytTR family transcriptional regulator [Bacteroidales bacterium]|jgi:DNA-binding LytR/AlgR family response regulator|nr:LytTR family transcriptional regulator [Bacteroidales bacterium]